MSEDAGGVVPGVSAKLLAVLSVVCFWLLPFSPVLAIGAVAKTRGVTSWPRRCAVAGAVLCTTYTLAMGLLMARACLELVL